MEWTGQAICAGAAIGPALVYRPERSFRRIADSSRPEERLECYRMARDKAGRELEQLAHRLDQEQAGRGDVLMAQSVLLDDPLLEEEIRAAVGEMETAEAVERVYQNYAHLLGQLEDSQIRARSADYLDMGQRILRHLTGEPGRDLSRLDGPCILVAEELLPSEVAALDRANVMGIVTQSGGDTSHAAIIARSYGIPTVMGVDGIHELVADGDRLALDCRNGEAGTVWIRPEEEQADRLREMAEQWQQEKRAQLHWQKETGRTRDGVRVSVLLNLTRGNEDELELAPYVDGVGLFRTEFLYLNGDTPPTEEEQYRCYRRVLEAFAPRPVTLRTIDLGGDKWPSYLEEQEGNLRGLALSLAHPELLRTQIRAALRAGAHGSLQLMLPMVANLDELEWGRQWIASAAEELRREGQPTGHYRLGVMIEVPELARRADAVARRVDFASLGTNDLCRELLGIDRLQSDAEVRCHPRLLELVSRTADAFTEAGTELSLCGELAGDPLATELLVGLGLRKLSVSPGAVAALKKRLANLDTKQAVELAQSVLRQKTARQAQDDRNDRKQEERQNGVRNDDHTE